MEDSVRLKRRRAGLQLGQRREDFELDGLLGRGSYACVYRAKSRHSGRVVALKVIDKQLIAASPGLAERVRAEAETHIALDHPSVVSLHTFFEDASCVYFVLELCEGGELYHHLRRNTHAMPEDEARSMFLMVLDGVKYLHAQHIVHRDLKLSNLLLTKDMQVKISDFGLSTTLQGESGESGTMCGTPNYMPPEVLADTPHGLSSDLWSLGCLLYTMLVGSPPFESASLQNTLDRIRRVDYTIPPSISPDAADLIQRLLQHNPSQRPSLQAISQHPFLCPPTSATSCSKIQDHATQTQALHRSQSSQSARDECIGAGMHAHAQSSFPSTAASQDNTTTRVHTHTPSPFHSAGAALRGRISNAQKQQHTERVAHTQPHTHAGLRTTQNPVNMEAHTHIRAHVSESPRLQVPTPTHLRSSQAPAPVDTSPYPSISTHNRIPAATSPSASHHNQSQGRILQTTMSSPTGAAITQACKNHGTNASHMSDAGGRVPKLNVPIKGGSGLSSGSSQHAGFGNKDGACEKGQERQCVANGKDHMHHTTSASQHRMQDVGMNHDDDASANHHHQPYLNPSRQLAYSVERYMDTSCSESDVGTDRSEHHQDVNDMRAHTQRSVEARNISQTRTDYSETDGGTEHMGYTDPIRICTDPVRISVDSKSDASCREGHASYPSLAAPTSSYAGSSSSSMVQNTSSSSMAQNTSSSSMAQNTHAADKHDLLMYTQPAVSSLESSARSLASTHQHAINTHGSGTNGQTAANNHTQTNGTHWDDASGHLVQGSAGRGVNSHGSFGTVNGSGHKADTTSFASALLSARSHTIATPVQSAHRYSDSTQSSPNKTRSKNEAPSSSHHQSSSSHHQSSTSHHQSSLTRSVSKKDSDEDTDLRPDGVVDARGLKPKVYETRHAHVRICEGGTVEVIPCGGGADGRGEYLVVNVCGRLVCVCSTGGEVKDWCAYAELKGMWKQLYAYAAKVITMVRSRSPKVTYYSPLAKASLMLDGRLPRAHAQDDSHQSTHKPLQRLPTFECVFYDGGRVGREGGHSEMRIKAHVVTLSEKDALLHAEECLRKCLHADDSYTHKGCESTSVFPLVLAHKKAIHRVPTRAASSSSEAGLVHTRGSSPQASILTVSDIATVHSRASAVSEGRSRASETSDVRSRASGHSDGRSRASTMASFMSSASTPPAQQLRRSLGDVRSEVRRSDSSTDHMRRSDGDFRRSLSQAQNISPSGPLFAHKDDTYTRHQKTSSSVSVSAGRGADKNVASRHAGTGRNEAEDHGMWNHHSPSLSGNHAAGRADERLSLGPEGRVYEFQEGGNQPATMRKTAFFPGFGWVLVLTDGTLWGQMLDGSQLVADQGTESVVYVAPDGQRRMLGSQGVPSMDANGAELAWRAEMLLGLRDVL